MDRDEYEAWKKAQKGELRQRKVLEKSNQAYNPRKMKVGMPTGCVVILLAGAGLLLYLLSRLFFA